MQFIFYRVIILKKKLGQQCRHLEVYLVKVADQKR